MKNYYKKILTLEFFELVYSICSSDKFIVSNEMFHMLFCMLEGDRVDKQLFREFFLSNMVQIMSSLVKTLNYFMSIEETYLVERDTLVVSIIILFKSVSVL